MLDDQGDAKTLLNLFRFRFKLKRIHLGIITLTTFIVLSDHKNGPITECLNKALPKLFINFYLAVAHFITNCVTIDQ